MAARQHLFLDFDGTLSDHAELDRQLVQTLSRMLERRFGATPDVWRAALEVELAASRLRYQERFVGNPLAGFASWIAAERGVVASSAFARAGIPYPTDVESLALTLQTDALKQCCALFPGTTETLRRLHHQGYSLHLASSQESAYLKAALSGSGVEPLFESWFGADLVDCAKEGPEYYRRVFYSAGVSAEDAIVVDDLPICLEWARAAGARAIRARPLPADGFGAPGGLLDHGTPAVSRKESEL